MFQKLMNLFSRNGVNDKLLKEMGENNLYVSLTNNRPINNDNHRQRVLNGHTKIMGFLSRGHQNV